ncbi:helix-turn-helix transcriptional regulator [Micromonospora sp. NPDC049559]|uniref:helix-turn-helix domain-containing protein n=1 Tax=Micromonospora sp. NPDC049559 TaxID=3155923 RepID=UPI003417A764
MEKTRVPARELIVKQLRRLRLAAGLTQEEFGKLINYSGSHVSAIELGNRAPDEVYLTRADRALETGGLFMALLELAKREAEPTWFRPWLDSERTATQLRCFEPNLVPGLLQTEEYARAVLRGDVTLSEAEVERLVAVRMERQKILEREDPPQVIAVLDELALRRFADGFAEIMAAQLLHLVALAERPRVSVHVVPASLGLHIGLSGPFVLARAEDGGWTGHLENQLNGTIVERTEDVATLLARWETLRNEALPRRQSLDLIKEIVQPWT